MIPLSANWLLSASESVVIRNRSIVTALTVFALMTGILALAGASGQRELTLKSQDDGTEVLLRVSDRFTFELAANPSTGFMWEISIAAVGNTYPAPNQASPDLNTPTFAETGSEPVLIVDEHLCFAATASRRQRWGDSLPPARYPCWCDHRSASTRTTKTMNPRRGTHI